MADQYVPALRSSEGEERMIEQEAVRRILVKTELSKGCSCNTFEELVMQVGFPLRLVIHKFRPKELDDLDVDMIRHPTKAPLIMAIDEIFEYHRGISQCDLGMVFPWRGYGGLHVLTNDARLPIQLGTSGRFWRIADWYYLLEHIDSFIQRLGPPAEW